MITPDEIARVAVLATLTPEECGRLSRTAADLRLAPGEYAVNEGDERALFAVLEGKIEVAKLVDGVVRILGERGPGEIFGEVPITLGTPFPSGFRAAESARVMRLAAADYYALASTAPEVAVKVGALARERIGGLQGVAAEPAMPRAVIVGHRWDDAAAMIRRFLDRNRITFRWVALEEPGTGEPSDEVEAPVAGVPYPLVRFADGTTVVQPSLRDVADRLGLATSPSLPEYEAVIVGAGPAGLAAAVYGASEGLRTLVVECEAPGGQAGTSSRIENYLGFPSGISGDELGGRALQQARRLGAEILVTRRSVSIDTAARGVGLDGGERVMTRTVILATGVSWRHLPIDGLDRLLGKGVHYGAASSEAGATHGLDVHIVGAGNSAGQAALNIANHANTVTVLCRGAGLEKSMSAYLVEQLRSKSNIEVMLESEIAGVEGDMTLTAVAIRNAKTGDVARVESGGLYIFIGADAETEWLPEEIALDRRGYVLTGNDVRAAGRWAQARDPYLLETSVPGIFACGDVRFGPVKRVAAAVGEGSMAIAFVHQYLKDG